MAASLQILRLSHMNENPQKLPKLWDILFWQFWKSEKGKCYGIFLQNFWEKKSYVAAKNLGARRTPTRWAEPPLTLRGSTVSLPPRSWPGAGSLRIHKLVATWCGRRSQQPYESRGLWLESKLQALLCWFPAHKTVLAVRGFHESCSGFPASVNTGEAGKWWGYERGLRNSADRRSWGRGEAAVHDN